MVHQSQNIHHSMGYRQSWQPYFQTARIQIIGLPTGSQQDVAKIDDLQKSCNLGRLTVLPKSQKLRRGRRKAQLGTAQGSRRA